VFLSESSVEKHQHASGNQESQSKESNISRRHKESLEALKGTDAAVTYFVDLNDYLPMYQEKSSNAEEEPSNLI